MSRLFAWIKSHKLIVLLMAVVTYLLVKQNSYSIMPMYNRSAVTSTDMMGEVNMAAPRSAAKGFSLPSAGTFMQEAAPAPEVTNRMVVSTSHVSLLVAKVADSLKQIKSFVESSGGYMVESVLSNPEEAANGTLTVRIPSDKLDQTLEQIKGVAVKVVSENLQGTDVTDQYQDTEERLRILERNKARLVVIMDKAVEISDIANIQQQIFQVQDQIDALKGQQNYLEKTSQMAKITVYLSTDELALPYAPARSWRPNVVFKYAVRSLLTNLQDAGSALIWVAVYSVVIVPLGLALYILYRTFRKKTTSPSR